MLNRSKRILSLNIDIKNKAGRFFRHENTILGIVLLALMGVLAIITKGLSIRRTNMSYVLLQSSNRGVAAIGQAFVILSGGLDLSVATVGLFSSVLGASLLTEHPVHNLVGHPVSIHIVLPLMILAGIGWGTLNGLLVSRAHVPALIVTLGMWQIAYGAAFQICGGTARTNLPDSLAFWGTGTVAGVPLPSIIFIVVAIVAYFVLYYTGFGRSVYSVGGSPISAWLSGVNVKRTQLVVFIISGFCAALAGLILTGRLMSTSMQSLQGLELDSIAAVAIGGVSLAGGRGTLIGVIIGVIIIGIINNGMSIIGADVALQGITKGGIIIAAVAIDSIRRR